jgi:RNA polymerase sigma factor (sigma-70 family)
VPARTNAADRKLPPFATVLAQHGPALLRFCRGQAGPDRGDDVFQDTMLAALRAYEGVRDPDAVKTWLFSIAARKAVDAHRAAARAAIPMADPEVVDRASSPAGEDAIWADVALLPEKQRQAVTLRYMADLSHREIATVMEISEAAVRRNVFEGLRRLRRELEAPVPDDLTIRPG